MAIAKVLTRQHAGLNSTLVTIEIDISQGLPSFTLIGLSSAASRGIRARVRSAIINSGYHFPAKKMTLSLTPDEDVNEGNNYDLPIAIAILIASGQVISRRKEGYEYYSGLSLEGSLSSCKGAISAIIAAIGVNHCIIVPESAYIPELNFNRESIIYAQNLKQVCRYLQGELPVPARHVKPASNTPPLLGNDLQTIAGQYYSKRALEIAAAGGHSLLMIGPPGTGKTSLAFCLPGLLPDLTQQERLELAQVVNLTTGHIDLPLSRPFRAPHHSITAAGLIGSIHPSSLGEITLAHQGVLFLDELLEFNRKTLDALRTPVELGYVALSRAKKHVIYPARFQLVAAMNLPLSYGLSDSRRCRSKYISNKLERSISAALTDRFQLSIEVTAPSKELMQSKGESSLEVRNRVVIARRVQLQRQGMENALLCTNGISRYCAISSDDSNWLCGCLEKLSLSHRAFLHILRIARTIADLQNDTEISRTSLQEALSYRYADRISQYLTQLYE
ncbi:YifB family Mg chelatase-like AAA ATPase [Rosenbergiella collisarenosi]|uniref:YifB family Mg chelatase-like AAA ATPase n=1 Tax=Rosenbergiella collisarenosi TaxID=1544695 RepID=UPI001F4D48DD|nr:YifB family Mg chelatase-like AAA ATPase [Rosenbergiella collisarenosi]